MIISGQWKIGVCVREQSPSASARRVIDWRVRLINIISKFFCLSVDSWLAPKTKQRNICIELKSQIIILLMQSDQIRRTHTQTFYYPIQSHIKYLEIVRDDIVMSSMLRYSEYIEMFFILHYCSCMSLFRQFQAYMTNKFILYLLRYLFRGVRFKKQDYTNSLK